MNTNSALKEADFGAGIHEDAKPRSEPVGEKTTGHAPIFHSEGAVGKHFTGLFLLPFRLQWINGNTETQQLKVLLAGRRRRLADRWIRRGVLGSILRRRGRLEGVCRKRWGVRREAVWIIVRSDSFRP